MRLQRKIDRNSGFTIVELLIVVVVVGILVAVSVIAYNGIQSRARDAQRKNDPAQLAKVTQIYAVDKGNYAEHNCGYVGGSSTGTGWLAYDYDGMDPHLSVDGCLLDAGVLTKPLVDPSGRDSCDPAEAPAIGDCHAYMKISCAAGTWYIANLENAPKTGTETDNTCSVGSDYDRAYGMNYVVRVK